MPGNRKKSAFVFVAPPGTATRGEEKVLGYHSLLRPHVFYVLTTFKLLFNSVKRSCLPCFFGGPKRPAEPYMQPL